MSWRWAGAWRPALHCEGDWTRSEVVAALHDCLRDRDRAPEFTLATEGEAPRELTLSPQEFADVARQPADRASLTDRVWADFCAAYGSHAFLDQSSIRETALRFPSGQQSFLGSIRELAGEPPVPTAGKRRASRNEGGGTVAHPSDHAHFEPWS